MMALYPQLQLIFLCVSTLIQLINNISLIRKLKLKITAVLVKLQNFQKVTKIQRVDEFILHIYCKHT